jgi:hypothetical protein
VDAVRKKSRVRRYWIRREVVAIPDRGFLAKSRVG